MAAKKVANAPPPAPIPKAGWGTIFSDLKSRLVDGFTNPILNIYFLFVIVLVAGIGLLITILRHYFNVFPGEAARLASWQAICESAGTYSIAISVPALADIIFAKQPTETRAFKAIFTAFTILVALCLSAAFGLPFQWALAGAIGSVVISWLQWWLINIKNPNLADDDNPSGTTGGDPLGSLSGTVEGFKT